MGEIATQEGVTSNRYTILGRLAGGGMADIFLARVLSEGGVQRHVVLKRVLAERSRDVEFAKMFLDEARLAAQLQHPNIAQLHDIGRLGGSYFYTMEYVHGADLRTILATLARSDRQLPINLAMLIVSQTLAALRHAHTRLGADGKPLGVVHRDVTPSNVMVSYEGSVKLLDFGVAKATQHTAESRSGTIKGKIAYLSPEQCQNGGVDARSDLFSLGIVLHEMLCLRRMYKRETDFSTMMAIVNEPPPVPSTIRPDIPQELDDIVLMALAKDPARRFRSATDMLEAIETFAANQRMVMSPTGLGRFLSELVGERPEPWLELPAPNKSEPTSMITITGESVPDIVTAASAATAMPDIAGEDALQAQLASAPPIGVTPHEGDSDPDLGSRSTAVAPVRPSRPPTASPPDRPSGRKTTPPAVPVVRASGVPAAPTKQPPSGPIRNTPVPVRATTQPPTPAVRSTTQPPSSGAPAAPTAQPPSGPIRAATPTGAPPSGPIRTPTGAPSAPMGQAPSGPIRAATPTGSGAPATPIAHTPSGPIRSAAPSAPQPIVQAPSGPIAGSPSASGPIAVTPSSGLATPVAGAPTPVAFDSPRAPTPTAFPAAQPDALVVESSRSASGRDERHLVTAAVTSLPFTPDPEGTKQRRIIAIVVGIVVVVILVVAIAKPGSNSATPEQPDAMVVRAPVPDDVAPAVALAPDAAEPVPEPPPDKPVAKTVAPPRTVPQQIDDAIATADWPAGLAVCRRETKLASADRGRCAIIACNAKEAALATTFYQAASRSSRSAIEKACKERGIAVAPKRGKDPCELNPLTCRK